MRRRRFEIGDWVVYRKLKYSASPGRRAKNICPAPNGDLYHYVVEKFWIVDGLLGDGRLRLRTRTGKIHLIESSDPNLRHASWWTRWIYRSRFRQLQAASDRTR